ncbi:MAG: pantoate--beta-alanine ligase [Chloroflexota bacterium]
MEIARTVSETKKIRRRLKSPVGLVPTMGYLHEGHLTLVRRSKKENASTVASIFVNPTQFGPKEDFGKYPRAPEVDLKMLEGLETDCVFMPPAEEIYPPGFNTWVSVEKVTEHLEGAVRPGHFRGVATVVAKLFNIVEPDRAYFGQKDAQQVVVVKKMVRDLNMNLEIVVVPTVREPDGLAMSSRNVYLNAKERKIAPVLYKSLLLARRLYAGGVRDAGKIRGEMTALIQKEPQTVIDYVSIADSDTLEELEEIKPPALVSLAVRLGRTRLLDNAILE